MRRRDFINGGVGLSAFLAGQPGFAGPFQEPSTAGAVSARQGAGDLAIVNAKIITLESRQPEAAAALVRNGKIIVVGSNQDVTQEARGARRFDAGGRTIVPGFVDAHCHMEVAAAAEMYCADLHAPPARNIPDLQRALKAKAAGTPKGQWVIGRSGFNLENSIDEKRLPNRLELDEVSMDHPVIIFSGRHISMVNTAALKEMGVWEPNSKLPRGTLVHRDSAGVPTGICTEIFYYLPEYSINQMKAAIKPYAMENFVTKGTTTIYVIPFSKNDIRADLELQRSGDLPLRVRMYYHVPHMISFDGFMDMGMLSGVGDDMYRFGGLKLFVDGAGADGLGHRYADLKWTTEELNDMVSRADAGGIQVIMHAVTAEGRRMAIAAVEETRRRNPRQPYILHRIEHAGDDGTAEGLRRLQDLGIRISITPGKIARGRTGGPRYRTLVKEHLEPVGITDATGTTQGSSDVLFKIACAATRASDGGGAPDGEELGFEDALRMFTIWNARIGYEDRYKGSIAAGKVGDFAVLSADPLGMRAGKLFDLKVQATIFGGEVVRGG